MLYDKDYVKKVNETIQVVAMENFKNRHDCKWEQMKCQIIECTQKYSRHKAQTNAKEVKNALNKIAQIKTLIDNETNIEMIDILNTKYHDQQSIVDAYETNRANGALIRSKARWFAEAGKNTKYFLGLEKSKYLNKTMKRLITEDNTVVRSQKKILLEQQKFYNRLYSKNPQVLFQFTQNEFDKLPKLTKENREELEQNITIKELGNALKTLNSDKTPGISGLPAEFYIFFWTQIKNYYFLAIQMAIEKNELHLSSQTGVLCLIPKKDKSPDFVKNWRPITLLNTDHKIYAKALALRLKNVLNYLITPDQTGYMARRFIGLNLRKIIDIIQYIEEEKIPALLISVDFEKCFDSIEFQAIAGMLEIFNFGPKFINMIFTLYNNFRTVLSNGNLSQAIYPQCGLHQGYRASGYIFLLTAELLAYKIRNNTEIKGIKIPNCETEETLSQFADDMDLIILFEEKSLQSLIDTLNEFYLNTGLKVNLDKTTIFRLGPIKHTKKKLDTSAQFQWADENITSLGIILDLDKVEDNYKGLINQINAIIKSWKKCNLGIIAKTTVLNSLIGSLLVYKLQVLPHMSKSLNSKIK